MEDQRVIMVIEQLQRRAADETRRMMLERRRLLTNMEESSIILTAIPWTAPYLSRNAAAAAAAAQSSDISWDTTDNHFIFSDSNHNFISSERRNFGTITQQQQQRSLGSLEKIQIEEGSESDCSICLTELSVGTEAIRLPYPCSHVYHQDCIIRWLNTSNTCPLCRRPVL